MNKKLGELVAGMLMALAVTANAGNTGTIKDSFAYPNPARERLKIRVTAQQQMSGQVVVKNQAGQSMATVDLPTPVMKEGSWVSEPSLTTANLPSGVYVYMVKTAGGLSTGRFVVLK